ncbi:hypothetical protein GCM10007852_16650 [Agaribacter marinus]|uniref:Uncharacterized protein n=1 Tax=Agaribacter marinus TaxID=1431249 RepID=A0AA37WID8_9ALTE|nr:hypothetical protein GCM10007852_16650 [Agaribacter marinus]
MDNYSYMRGFAIKYAKGAAVPVVAQLDAHTSVNDYKGKGRHKRHS